MKYHLISYSTDSQTNLLSLLFIMFKLMQDFIEQRLSEQFLLIIRGLDERNRSSQLGPLISHNAFVQTLNISLTRFAQRRRVAHHMRLEEYQAVMRF